MPITFGGINTGLPPNIVEKIIEAESIPIKTLQRKVDNNQVKLGLVNDLEGRLGKIRTGLTELAGTKGFMDMKLISSDPGVVDGVIDPALSQPGTWQLEVKQMARKSAAITNGFPDKDTTEIGVGYFRFETADGPKDVYINGESSTLVGAASAINNSGLGMRATVVNDRKDPDYPYRLVISRTDEGEENEVDYPNLYFLDGDQDVYFEETKPAQNAIVSIDGFDVEMPDNTIEDLIPGVTLTIKGESDRPISVTVKEDLEVVSGKVQDFVDGVNEVLSFIQQQNSLDANTDTSRTLGGDSLLRTIEFRMRRIIQGVQFGTGAYHQHILRPAQPA